MNRVRISEWECFSLKSDLDCIIAKFLEIDMEQFLVEVSIFRIKLKTILNKIFKN